MKILCPKCSAETGVQNKAGGLIKCDQCGEWCPEPSEFSAYLTSGHPAASSLKLNACPSCANQVSPAANSCPKCGHVFHQPGGISLKDPVHIVGLLVCVVMAILAALFIWGRTVGF